MLLVITTFILAPLPTYICRFLDPFIFPLLPPPISSGFRRITDHHTRSPTPLLARNASHLYFANTHLPPSSASYYVSRSAFLRLPPYPTSFCPPRCFPRSAPRSLLAPGGSPAADPSVFLVSRIPPCAAPLPVIF